jgi:hypothetical protein
LTGSRVFDDELVVVGLRGPAGPCDVHSGESTPSRAITASEIN